MVQLYSVVGKGKVICFIIYFHCPPLAWSYVLFSRQVYSSSSSMMTYYTMMSAGNRFSGITAIVLLYKIPTIAELYFGNVDNYHLLINSARKAKQQYSYTYSYTSHMTQTP